VVEAAAEVAGAAEAAAAVEAEVGAKAAVDAAESQAGAKRGEVGGDACRIPDEWSLVAVARPGMDEGEAKQVAEFAT